MRQCDLLIVDEGCISLDKKETMLLHAVLRQLRGQGVTIIYISHLLDDVVRLSDQITVLRNGALVETLEARSTTAEDLAVAVVGHEMRRPSRAEDTNDLTQRRMLLDVKGLSWTQDAAEFFIVISTEFAELVGVVNTLLVIVNRKIVTTLTGGSITPHEIVRYYQYEVETPSPSFEGTSPPAQMN